MNPKNPEPGLPRRHHHHQVHLHLDPRHHHHVHIHLCCCQHHHHHHHHGAHLVAPATPAHLHDNQQRHPAPVHFPNTYPSAAPWQPPAPPRAAVREEVEDLDPGPGRLHAEEADDEEGEPVFVLTDEWAEFFAKSEAKRRLAKQQKKNGRK